MKQVSLDPTAENKKHVRERHSPHVWNLLGRRPSRRISCVRDVVGCCLCFCVLFKCKSQPARRSVEDAVWCQGQILSPHRPIDESHQCSSIDVVVSARHWGWS